MFGKRAAPERQTSDTDLPQRQPLKGEPFPPAESLDVASWSGPHSFVVHRREELGTLLAVVLVMVPSRLVEAFGFEYTDLLGRESLVSEVLGMAAIFLLPATLGLLAFRTQIPARGRVTIDPGRDRIELRASDENSSAVQASWAFSDVRVPGFSNGGSGIDSVSSGTVALDLGDRALMIRVPRGRAEELAVSLRRAVDRSSGAGDADADPPPRVPSGA